MHFGAINEIGDGRKDFMLLVVVLPYLRKKRVLEAENTNLAKMHILDIIFLSLNIKLWYPDSTELCIKVKYGVSSSF